MAADKVLLLLKLELSPSSSFPSQSSTAAGGECLNLILEVLETVNEYVRQPLWWMLHLWNTCIKNGVLGPKSSNVMMRKRQRLSASG